MKTASPLTLVRMAASNASDSAQAVGKAATAQSSQALIVQSYSLSALQQSKVDFSGFPNLGTLGADINSAITSSQTHASSYLNVVLPNMITTISNIDSYFNLQNALGQALSPSTPADQAIQLMATVQKQAETFQTQSSGVVTSLQQLRSDLSTDAGNFSSLVSQLNAAVDGDNGVLSQIKGELGDIDGKIAGAITGTVLSGLAIAGGVFLIAVGAIADFVTAGTSTPLVIAGIGIVAAGVGGEVASAVTLANLIKLKNELLTKESLLKSEVNLATGMSSGLNSLATSAASAATASQQMANAWGLLGNDLGALISQLKNGQTTVDAIRLLYQTAAQGTVKTVQGDIQTIRGQLAGTQQVNTTPGQTVDQTIVQVAQQNQKKAA